MDLFKTARFAQNPYEILYDDHKFWENNHFKFYTSIRCNKNKINTVPSRLFNGPLNIKFAGIKSSDSKRL